MLIAKSFFRYITAIIILLPGMANAGDCWLDVYAETGFKGEHTRIEGPTQLSSLRNVAGSDWRNRIDSLAVGPKAMVRVYHKEGFKDDTQMPPNHADALKAWGEKKPDSSDEASFGPNQKYHHLGELNFHHNINSLKIDCN